MSGNVTSLHGGPTGELEVVSSCVEAVETVLEQAKAGQVIGAAIVVLNHDGVAGWHLGGRIGGYSMLGASSLVHQLLLEASRDDD